MNRKEHWEQVYTTRHPNEVGWYEPHLKTSLAWIRELSLPRQAPILDVGGGASTLVDDLLLEGYDGVVVLDLSCAALSAAKARLGPAAARVQWLEDDITQVELPERRFSLWHDRAVLHFLIEPEDRDKYVRALYRGTQPDGHTIIGVFAPEAPPRCSGLPVQRYTPDDLQDLLGADFMIERHHKELHLTPAGTEQMYVYCQFRRVRTD